jgi:hypothetical protein
MLFSAQEYKPKGHLGLVCALAQRDDMGGKPDFVGTCSPASFGIAMLVSKSAG